MALWFADIIFFLDAGLPLEIALTVLLIVFFLPFQVSVPVIAAWLGELT